MITVIQANGLAIIVGSILAFGFGMIWYHPKIFGTIWANEQPHIKNPDGFGMQKGMALGMASSVVDSLLMASVIALLLTAYQIEAVGLLALAIIVGTHTGTIFRGGSHKLWLVDAGFLVSQLLIILVCLTVL